jgi:hypothetical protein
MTTEDARLLQLQIPGCLVLSTPSIQVERFDSREENPTFAPSACAPSSHILLGQNGNGHDDDKAWSASSSGGVAVLLPTYLCSTQVGFHELIPGYAIAAAFAMKSFAWCVVSVYLRPKHEKRLLTQLTLELKKLITSQSYDSFLLLGDFNQAKKLHEWDILLGTLDLVDLLPSPTNTF